MKIPRVTTIPLAQIEKNIKPTGVVFTPAENFRKNTSVVVNPHDTFTNATDLFFDVNNNIVDVDLHYVNNAYIYEPDDTVEFIPSEFSMYTVIKKNMVYDVLKQYNINVTVDSLENWPDLISIFGTANERGLCPPNIKINSGSLSESSLASGSYEDTDILFIKTPNGKTYTDNTDIPLIDILKQHACIWLAIDDYNETLFSQSYSSTATNTYRSVYNENITFNPKDSYIINSNIEHTKLEEIVYPGTRYSVEEIYDTNPIIFLHVYGYGYIIISHSGLFNNLADNSRLIYDAMMYAYMNTYVKSDAVTSWITEDNIDFVGSITQRLNQNHKQINLDKIVAEIDENIGTQYSIFEVRFIGDEEDTQQVAYYIDTGSNSEMYFGKYQTGDNIDPIKPEGFSSLLTTKGSVIYYNPENLRKNESLVRGQSIINSDTGKCYVSISPFTSSSNRLKVIDNTLLEVPDVDKVYNILALPVNEDGLSVLSIKERAEGIDNNYVKIGEAYIEYEDSKRCNDLRQSGGGLPENLADDYEMMDISNLYGRLIRRGTSLIVRLPRQYEKYDSYIRDALNKYKNASTYIVVHYDDEE